MPDGNIPVTVSVEFVFCCLQITTNLATYSTNLLPTVPVGQESKHKITGFPAGSTQAEIQARGYNHTEAQGCLPSSLVVGRVQVFVMIAQVKP